MIIASPQEPIDILDVLSVYGDTRIDAMPEGLGADYIVGAGICGIQRKTEADLIASAQDGRLADELRRLDDMPERVLIVEGRERWEADGRHPFRRGWTITGVENQLVTVQRAGVVVQRTMSHLHTAARIVELDAYYQQEHLSLAIRPRSTPEPVSDEVWFLQGLPGIGIKRAQKLYDELGLPLAWTCSEYDLGAVLGPNVGSRAYNFLRREQNDVVEYSYASR